MPGNNQPYRKGQARPAGPTLSAMLMGKPKFRPHPKDAERKLQKRRAFNNPSHTARRWSRKAS